MLVATIPVLFPHHHGGHDNDRSRNAQNDSPHYRNQPGSRQTGGHAAGQRDSRKLRACVAEVVRRDGIKLNGVDMRNIRTRVLEMLSYRRRVQMYQEKEKITYHWKKPEWLRR